MHPAATAGTWRNPVLPALVVLLLSWQPSFAAKPSWVPAEIRKIVETNPDVWFFRTDAQPEENLMDIRIGPRYREALQSLVATRLKTAYRVSEDQRQKLFALLLFPANYTDPSLDMDMMMNPPSVACIFKSKTGVAIVAVGDWCVEIIEEDRGGDWRIFSGKGASAFKHWANRQERAGGMVQKAGVKRAQFVAEPLQ